MLTIQEQYKKFYNYYFRLFYFNIFMYIIYLCKKNKLYKKNHESPSIKRYINDIVIIEKFCYKN